MPRSRSARRPRSPRPVRPTDTFPTTDEIAARAHDLFVADGRRVAKISEHWRQAEEELLDIAARRTLTGER